MRRFRKYCRNLPASVSNPLFVKVGANDGITDDPCSDILLANKQWKGLLIEPVPYCFDSLRANFYDSDRFILEQVAIGSSCGRAKFYYVDQKAKTQLPDLPPYFDKLASFDRNHILKHLGGILEPFIVECELEVYPLSGVLQRNSVRDVHLLHIDAEGYDYEVLRSVDFEKFPPLSVFVEHKHLTRQHRTEMLRLFAKHGYSVSDCGVDYFAINNKANKRLRRTRRFT
jgi:FkbM family methyltransferase